MESMDYKIGKSKFLNDSMISQYPCFQGGNRMVF
jgi:hypothetical protein